MYRYSIKGKLKGWGFLHKLVLSIVYRYIQEWLGCMILAGIVTINEDGTYSLPYETNQLKLWGYISTVLPILSQIFPQLQKTVSQDGPEGVQRTEYENAFYNIEFNIFSLLLKCLM